MKHEKQMEKKEAKGDEEKEEGVETTEEKGTPTQGESIETAKSIRDDLAVLVERAERLKAEDMLGGESEAGTVQPPPDPEVEAKRRANKMVAGTGFKPYPDID